MIVYGAGGHAKVVIDCLETIHQSVELIIDDDANKTSILSYPVNHGYDPDVFRLSQLIIAIGNNSVRKKIAEETIKHKAGIIVHPNTQISPYVSLGAGTVIFNAAIIQTDVKIGYHVIVNTSAIIEHDCVIEDYAHIAPNATLCGEVTIGEGTLIGAGAIVLPGITIGRWSTIGAGCVIKHNVPDHSVIKNNVSLQRDSNSSLDEQNIYLSPPHLGFNERKYIDEVFSSNWIAPKGEALELFENNICRLTGSLATVAISSGTAALHLGLILLGIGEEDEVICPTFTFAATANPILYQKAIPIFIDCEPDSWNMDLDFLEQAIEDRMTKGKKPKAIIAVHNYGMPMHMKALLHLARQYDIPVIEDAAEAMGSQYEGKFTGTFGTMGVYSFNGNKIITTGGGGALVASQPNLIEQAKFLATQACDNVPFYQHSFVGYNYRLSNVLAAIGNAQLEVLAERVTQRRAIFDYYRSHLSNIPGITFQEESKDCHSNRWLSCIAFKGDEGHTRIERIKQTLQNAGIEARYLWKPLHTQPVFKKFPYYGSAIAERLFNNGMCLPSGSALTPAQLVKIVKIIREQC